MYSVAVMPLLLAVGWRVGAGLPVRWGQALGFLLAAVLLLLWENLSNDLFDADTGIDTTAKPHSVVALLGRRRPVRRLSALVLLAGLLLMLLMALQSSVSVLALVLVSCGIGYLYQGPPFRLGYLGLGEPLCWLAFGPFATAAALLVVAPTADAAAWAAVPWDVALLLGSGPALATSLVLFCSHFHQVEEDAAHGNSPLWCVGHRTGVGAGALVRCGNPGVGVDSRAPWRLASDRVAWSFGLARCGSTDPLCCAAITLSRNASRAASSSPCVFRASMDLA